MTRDDIMRMSREAVTKDDGGYFSTYEYLERFAALVAAAEREACAKVCDAAAKKMDDEGEGPTGYISWVYDCATAIRARGNK
jgi:hypothetical protein